MRDVRTAYPDVLSTAGVDRLSEIVSRIIRTAKKGPNAGTQFYGCSNYPKCKYTRNKN
jgi:hypothetical protein